MDPITIMAIMSAVQGLFQVGTGISQQIQAGNLRKEFERLGENRPQYQTPQEVLSSLSLIKQGFADPRMAGQSKLEDLVGLTQANTIQAGVQGGNPFAVLAASQGQADLTQQDIQTRAMQQQENDRLNLAQALNTVAQFKDQEWQMNEFAPWRDKYQFTLNEYRDKLGAGAKNTFEGIGSLGSSGMSFMAMGGGGGGQVDINQLMALAGGQQPAQQDVTGIDWSMFSNLSNIDRKW